MFVSYNWLKEFVDLTDETPESLSEKITKGGIEVESVNTAGLSIEKVVTGHVLSCEKHPDADKLRVCQVDVGDTQPIQIVCGAANVAAGQTVPVALVGAVLPGGFKIKQGNLRGQESNGMICSLAELGVDAKLTPKEFATGIYVFPAGTPAGAPAVATLGLNDAIIELGLTPNRTDCLNMIGVAYEVAAILSKPTTFPAVEYPCTNVKASDFISVKVEANENPLYIAKVIKNVKIEPSPLWMQAYLIACGVRPHSNVVDITNYVLMEYGQPLHAFDYDKLGSKEIVVRNAMENEKIITLDDVERTVDVHQMVITNGQVPVAIAGVMGGADSAVSETTTTIVLESAYFNAESIRQASKQQSIRTDSSVRFEKGVDPNQVYAAAERAAQLLHQYAGGEVAEGSVVVGHLDTNEREISVTMTKINAILGMNLSETEVCDILTRLQYQYQLQAEEFVIQVPTRRRSLQIAEDVIEDIASIYGYDNLPMTLPQSQPEHTGLSGFQARRRAVRKFFNGAGLNQTITYSLVSERKAGQFSLYNLDKIKLAMPMSEEHSTLRQSIAPSLLEVLRFNKARQIDHLAIFETGSVYLKDDETGLPEEVEHIAGGFTGMWHSHMWQGERKAVDFFVVKGILESLFSVFGLSKMIVWKPVELEGMHPGRTAEILLQNGKRIGYCGQVHPQVAKRFDLKDTYVFELSLQEMFNVKIRPIKFSEIPRFPSISRDIALVVDSAMTAGQIKKTIEKAGGRLLKEVLVFDIYEGANIDEGKKSIAFSLKYFDPNKTLTDDEVNLVHNEVIHQVQAKCGAALRA